MKRVLSGLQPSGQLHLGNYAGAIKQFIRMQDIVREIGKVNQLRRIVIHCVSLGRDSTLLKRLASENGGRYVRR